MEQMLSRLGLDVNRAIADLLMGLNNEWLISDTSPGTCTAAELSQLVAASLSSVLGPSSVPHPLTRSVLNSSLRVPPS